MNSKGGILLIVCLALGMAGLFGGIYFVMSSTAPEKGHATDPLSAFEELRDRVDGVVKRNDILNASVERNPNSFACLYTTNAGCEGRGGPFLIFEDVGSSAQPLSQLVRDAGMNLEGMGCRGFPSEICPLRVEASWSPVCSPGRCEGTRSARLKFQVLLDDGKGTTRNWEKQAEITPYLKLSQAVTCERGGGVWALTECLSTAEAAQRQIASGHSEGVSPALERATEAPVVPEIYCPPDLLIQGELYQLERIGPNRSQARVPAMNGCPAEDVFTFQCQGNSPDAREGQWIQVEAQMAPGCLPPADLEGGAVNPEGQWTDPGYRQ